MTEDQEEADGDLALGNATSSGWKLTSDSQTSDNQLIIGSIDNLILTTDQLTHHPTTPVHHNTIDAGLSHESGHEAATISPPTPLYDDPNFGGSTTLLSMFNSPPCDDANLAQLDSIQMPSGVPTQYHVPSDSWFNNLLDNLPSSNLQNANLDSTFAQAYSQGLRVPSASEAPVKNVLPLVETGTFFFPSTSPLPAIPIPAMQPPLFSPTEAQECCLPVANWSSPGHAHHTPPQTVLPHATLTPPLPPPTPLLAGGVTPAVLSGPNQSAFTTLAPHAPSPQTVVSHGTPIPPFTPPAPLLAGGVTPVMLGGPNQLAFTTLAPHVPSPQTVVPHVTPALPFPPPAPPLAAPTVLSGPKHSAPSPSDACQPLMSSLNEVSPPHPAPLGTLHTDSPAPSTTPAVPAEKENNHPAVVKGMANRGRNGRKRKAGEAVQGKEVSGDGGAPEQLPKVVPCIQFT